MRLSDWKEFGWIIKGLCDSWRLLVARKCSRISFANNSSFRRAYWRIGISRGIILPYPFRVMAKNRAWILRSIVRESQIYEGFREKTTGESLYDLDGRMMPSVGIIYTSLSQNLGACWSVVEYFSLKRNVITLFIALGFICDDVFITKEWFFHRGPYLR